MLALLRRIAALVLTAVLPLTTTACYDWTGRGPDVVPADHQVTDSIRILGIVTTDAEVFEFEEGAKISKGYVVGESKAKGDVRVPLEKVQRFTIAEKKLNTWKTVGLVGSSLGGIVTAIAVSGLSGISSSKASTSTGGGGCSRFSPGMGRDSSLMPSRTPVRSHVASSGMATSSSTGFDFRRAVSTGF